MQAILRTLFFSGCLVWAILASGQTSGISEVNSIITKAETWEKNNATISRLKNELVALEPVWQAKLQRMRDEIAALYKERDDLIADMKTGARCSQCRKYKSDFEKEGVSFEKHLGEVKGYAVPATTEELESTRKYYAEKIAYKKVQLQQAEKGDPAIISKKKEIGVLEGQNARICTEITAHSKSYENRVFEEAKGYQENWISALCGVATDILISEDRVLICQAAGKRAEQAFNRESELVKEKLRQEVREKQQRNREKILLNDQLLAETRTTCTREKQQLEVDLLTLQQELADANRQVVSLKLSDSIKAGFRLLIPQLTERIRIQQAKIADKTAFCNNKIAGLESANKTLADENFRAESGLPALLVKEVDKLRPRYDQLKREAIRCEETAAATAAGYRKQYATLSADCSKRNQLFFDVVVVESNRMLEASRKPGCTIWNETRGLVMGNWNKWFPCVNALTKMSKPYSTNVFNSYCSGPAATLTCLSAYQSFLQSLSAEDLSAVKGGSNQDWFDKLMK